MTDASAFLTRLEEDVKRERRATPETCREFSLLPTATQRAFRRVVEFIGCPGTDNGDDETVEELDPSVRKQAARLMLLRLFADTPDPRWSSRVLEDLVDAWFSLPQSGVNDIFQALVEVWEENGTPLTSPVTALVKDLTVLLFRRDGEAYDTRDFSWLTDHLARRAHATTAYLALLALPSQFVPKAKPLILSALAGTPYAESASAMLDDED
jgi:hypothetical protein